MQIGAIIGIAALALLVLIIIARCIYVVQQAKAYVIERLGKFHDVWGVGLHFKLPFFERVAKKVSLKEQVLDYPPQPVITKDNVTMQIDTVVYFQITDPRLYTYGVEYPMVAMETLTATTLRNIIGDLELDETLTSRDVINTKMRAILDEVTDPWGKHSKILIAEGERESAVLRADAEKQAAVLKAEGEAQAILTVQKALADSLKLLNEASPNDQVIKLKALEAMQRVANGQATKIIIPSELQGLAGLAAGVVEAAKTDK